MRRRTRIGVARLSIQPRKVAVSYSCEANAEDGFLSTFFDGGEVYHTRPSPYKREFGVGGARVGNVGACTTGRKPDGALSRAKGGWRRTTAAAEHRAKVARIVEPAGRGDPLLGVVGRREKPLRVFDPQAHHLLRNRRARHRAEVRFERPARHAEARREVGNPDRRGELRRQDLAAAAHERVVREGALRGDAFDHHVARVGDVGHLAGGDLAAHGAVEHLRQTVPGVV